MIKKFCLFSLIFVLLVSFTSGALTDNLSNYYKLDFLTGSLFIDSLNSSNMTNNEGVVIAGKISNASSLNGSTSDMRIARQDPTVFSVGMWVQITGKGNRFPLISHGRSNPTEGDAWNIVFNDTPADCAADYFSMAFYNGAWSCIVGTTKPVLNTWYFVNLVYNGTMGFLYVNGVQEANVTRAISYNSNNDPICFGEFAANGYCYNQIKFIILDEISFYNTRAITQAEVTELYNDGAGLSYPFTASNSCTYSGSGVWSIKGGDNCSLVSTIGDASQLMVNGSGTTTISSVNVTNFNPITIIGHTLRIIGGILRVN